MCVQIYAGMVIIVKLIKLNATDSAQLSGELHRFGRLGEWMVHFSPRHARMNCRLSGAICSGVQPNYYETLSVGYSIQMSTNRYAKGEMFTNKCRVPSNITCAEE